MKSYDVEISREGRWWMVAIPALDGLTQARRLGEAEDMAREYIAVTRDVALSQVRLGRVRISVGDTDLSAVGEELARLRQAAAEAEASAAELVRETAATLSHEGVPMRDIGTLLGLSHQRIGQIVA